MRSSKFTPEHTLQAIRQAEPGTVAACAQVTDRADGLPRRILTEEGPQTRTVDLSNLRPNGTFPTGTFSFKVPAGVKVVDQ